jgi:hypothetical protein
MVLLLAIRLHEDGCGVKGDAARLSAQKPFRPLSNLPGETFAANSHFKQQTESLQQNVLFTSESGVLAILE